MAARAGSLAHADPGVIRQGLARALVPVHGGGSDTAELAASYARALADVTAYSRIELLNPTRESFDDWNAQALQEKYGRRAIPNGNARTFELVYARVRVIIGRGAKKNPPTR